MGLVAPAPELFHLLSGQWEEALKDKTSVIKSTDSPGLWQEAVPRPPIPTEILRP